jgi:steroid delta-isomerase-like uncharacterized protein
MSTEQNKANVRRFFEEVWNKGNLDVIDELVAANHVDHDAPPGIAPGSEGQKQFVTMYRNAFPDVHIHIEDQVAEGDRVVTRWSAHGTNTGSLFGMPATGKAATVTGTVINRWENDKNVESWNAFDQLGMLQQLGVIPTPGQ